MKEKKKDKKSVGEKKELRATFIGLLQDIECLISTFV